MALNLTLLMEPTVEELELGGKAYRLVQNYEKNGSQSLRPQLWVITIIFGLLVVTFILVPDHSSRTHDYSKLAIIVAPIAAVALFRQHWAARESYAQSKLLLKLLKEKYGERLPWLIEEKELALARELEMKIAKESQA